MRVLIVGAGPTGLTAAVELARRGVEATVADRRPDASPFSRAVGITPASLALLAPSGATERILAEATQLRWFCVYRQTKLLARLLSGSTKTPYPHLVALPQDRTELALAAALRDLGGDVAYGRELTWLEDRGDRVAATFADGRSDVFDHVVGADGIHSTVRQAAGIAYPGFDLPETWSIADVETTGWRHPEAFTLVQGDPGVMVVVAPMAADRQRVVANREDALATLPLPLTVTHIRRAGVFRISIRQAATYSKGRVHLAGDAAHCHSPVGGRGMNLGIADAAELARRLADDDLAGYSALRHEVGRVTMAGTERARRLIMSRSWAGRALFAGLARATGAVPSLGRRIGAAAVEA